MRPVQIRDHGNEACRRSFHAECTGSHPNSEVKLHRDSLVLGWGTTRESGLTATFLPAHCAHRKCERCRFAFCLNLCRSSFRANTFFEQHHPQPAPRAPASTAGGRDDARPVAMAPCTWDGAKRCKAKRSCTRCSRCSRHCDGCQRQTFGCKLGTECHQQVACNGCSGCARHCTCDGGAAKAIGQRGPSKATEARKASTASMGLAPPFQKASRVRVSQRTSASPADTSLDTSRAAAAGGTGTDTSRAASVGGTIQLANGLTNEQLLALAELLQADADTVRGIKALDDSRFGEVANMPAPAARTLAHVAEDMAILLLEALAPKNGDQLWDEMVQGDVEGRQRRGEKLVGNGAKQLSRLRQKLDSSVQGLAAAAAVLPPQSADSRCVRACAAQLTTLRTFRSLVLENLGDDVVRGTCTRTLCFGAAQGGAVHPAVLLTNMRGLCAHSTDQNALRHGPQR